MSNWTVHRHTFGFVFYFLQGSSKHSEIRSKLSSCRALDPSHWHDQVDHSCHWGCSQSPVSHGRSFLMLSPWHGLTKQVLDCSKRQNFEHPFDFHDDHFPIWSALHTAHWRFVTFQDSHFSKEKQLVLKSGILASFKSKLSVRPHHWRDPVSASPFRHCGEASLVQLS